MVPEVPAWSHTASQWRSWASAPGPCGAGAGTQLSLLRAMDRAMRPSLCPLPPELPQGSSVSWPHSDRGSLPLFSSRPPAWLALTGPWAVRDFPESSELTGGAGAGRDQVPPGASKEERRDLGQHKARRPRRGRGPVVDAPGHLGPVTRLSTRSLSTIPGGGRFQEFKGGPWWRCMGERPRRACASQVRP